MGRRIRDAAHMQPCSLRLWGCANDPATTVFAHLPSIDKGIGKKSPDFWGVFACAHCHDVIDRRKSTSQTRKKVEERFLPALFETQKELIDKGLIIVKD